MASINSFADVVRNWESLIAAVRERGNLEDVLEAELEALEKDLTDVRLLKAEQEAQGASRQELTQKIKEVVAHGKALAINIRAVARGKVGYRNEGLVLFKVAPIRSRPQRPAEILPPDPPPEVEDAQ